MQNPRVLAAKPVVDPGGFPSFLETSQNLRHMGWVWSIIMGVVNYYDVMNTPTSISARGLLAMKRKHPAAGQLSIDGFYKRLRTTG